MQPAPPPVFFFDDMVVGLFADGVYPAHHGEVRFSPFRGPGHLQFRTAMQQAGGADCYFKRGDQKVAFRVVDYPRYGLLSICGLS
jgi:hypothetical protein